MNIRAAIAKSLSAGAVLLLVLVLSGPMWCLFAHLGDRSMVSALKGIFLVTALCWMLDFVLLVVLLAIAAIVSPEPRGNQDLLGGEGE